MHIEALGRMVLELLYEASLQVVGATLLVVVLTRGLEPSRIPRPADSLGAMLPGFAAGLFSAMMPRAIAPRMSYIGSGFWRAVYLLMTPILTGLVIWAVGKVGNRRRGAAAYRGFFAVGWGFAVSMAAVRLCLLSLGPGHYDELVTGIEYPSPDGTRVAAFYGLRRGHDAWSWQHDYVSVRPSGTSLDTNDFVLEMEYATEVCLRWVKSDRLQIAIPDQAVVQTKAVASHGVAITVVPYSSASGEPCDCLAHFGGKWGQCSKRAPG